MANTPQVTAKDVAKYILKLSEQIGEPVTNMKLQKLLYYSYVWYLIETKKRKRLFNDPIVAWRYGPIVKGVYKIYSKYGADPIKNAEDGDDSKLDNQAKAVIEDVFKVYGAKNAIDLMDLSHSEQPWLQTFEEGKENVIDDDKIFAFYSSLKTNYQHE